MEIKTVFKNNEKIPEKYTADGDDVNPELMITDIPEGVKSLVLVVDDPDAQKVVGYTWIHWVRFNIPVEGNQVMISENSVPGTTGESTYKKPEYGGPNPPAGTGDHRYFFKVFALDTELDLSKGASLSEIKNAMQNHIINKAELIGLYGRS